MVLLASQALQATAPLTDIYTNTDIFSMSMLIINMFAKVVLIFVTFSVFTSWGGMFTAREFGGQATSDVGFGNEGYANMEGGENPYGVPPPQADQAAPAYSAYGAPAAAPAAGGYFPDPKAGFGTYQGH